MPPRFFALSRLLQFVSLTIMLLLPAGMIAAIAIAGPRELVRSGAMGVVPDTSEPGLAASWGALAVGGVVILATMYALWQMSRLFAAFYAGRIIAPSTAKRLFLAGKGLTATALLSICSGPAQSLLLSWHAGEGKREVLLDIGPADVFSLVAGGLLVLVGYAMREAVALKEENRGFV